MQPTTIGRRGVDALRPAAHAVPNEVSKLPAEEQARRIAMVLAALRGK